MMKNMKILEIGGYPPPNTGWSVRIKFLKEGFLERGIECKVLNLGRNRKISSTEYVDVQNGIDYFKKLFLFAAKGYRFHMHMNAQAVKGPILSLMAQFTSLLFGRRVALTFHGGIEQLYFPRKNAGKMLWIIILNFILAKIIICNNRPVKEHIIGYGPFVKRRKVTSIPAFSLQYLAYKKVELPDRIANFIDAKQHVILCYIILRNGFYLDTTAEFLKKLNESFGVILSGISTPEDSEVEGYLETIQMLQSKGTVLIVEDMDHDTFMSLLKACTLYLRTPVSDGVASSVLEALSQGIPVVASENGRRPSGVVCYQPDNPLDLFDKVIYVIQNYKNLTTSIKAPEIEDTLDKEINALKNNLF